MPRSRQSPLWVISGLKANRAAPELGRGIRQRCMGNVRISQRG